MKLRVLMAAGVAMLLAGCGSVHPGAAAVVDDTVVSMNEADDTAMTYCRLTLLQGAQGQPPSSADIRRQAVHDLVLGVVARTLADREDIRPSQSAFTVTGEQRRQLRKAVPDDELDTVIEVVEHTQETYAIIQEIGQRVVGPDADADPRAVQEAGLKRLQSALDRREVSYDPRFGMKPDGKAMAEPDPMSVSGSSIDTAAKGLPATQRCA